MLKVLLFSAAVFIGNYSYGQDPLPYTVPKEDTTKFLFEYKLYYVGSNTTIDLNYQYVLQHLVDTMLVNPNWDIHVRGHVCCGPSERISKRRAKKVYRFLKRSGINKTRIDFKGYSDTMPMAFPEESDEDEHMNRRVDFIISY